MAAGRSPFRWYKVQLGLAFVLQVMGIAAPLSYGGNWSAQQTAFLHPGWVAVETYDLQAGTSQTTTYWFFERWELAILVVWMAGLSIFMAHTLLARLSIKEKYIRLGNSFGGFAAQIILAYFVSRSVIWHLKEGEGAVELILQREFFFLLFPIIFIYLARRRIARSPEFKK